MVVKGLFLSLFGFGIMALVQIAMPVISYKAWELTTYTQNIALISPHSESSVLGVSIETQESFPAFVSSKNGENRPYSEFRISIPTLKLDNLKVVVDSNNFDYNLAHLPGTVLPGEKGNVFITGHSSLPQFFRPENFKAIFAKLPDIKKGDSIYVEANEQTYEYIVKGLKVVDPSETWVINPPEQQGRYLTLMTCVPPGLYLKRLIVLTELKS